jgi:hypothetical protein
VYIDLIARVEGSFSCLGGEVFGGDETFKVQGYTLKDCLPSGWRGRDF